MTCRLKKILFFAVASLMFFSACVKSSNVKSDANPEDLLKQKVQAEWEARVNKKKGIIYDMTTKAFQEKVSRDEFLQQAGIGIQNFTIKEIKITEPDKKAESSVEYSTNQMGFDFTFTSKEDWLWEDGDWRLNLSPVKNMMSPFEMGSEKK
ncbi:MAG: hypothetical protein BWK80_62505 [Desulfobacteraceae bacterium IS3]|nr:MAG: hypothetical protein BWK80_62505 [Desulfobacteraceae bacterium IS3]